MTPQDQQQQNIHSVGGDTVREQDKIMLVLAYVGLLSLIPFITVKDSEFLKWHAKQGLVLFGLFIAFSLINAIPILGTLIYCVGFLGYLGVSILAIVKALKGERWNLPLVSDLASKF